MNIGLLFGSFDPIHRGHTAIAQWALGSGGQDEVWIVISPQNPMKNTASASYDNRVAMVELAISAMPKVSLCQIECTLCPPYYTINTIETLQKENPDHNFSILCGTDIIKQSQHWHRANELHQMVQFVEYPRYENESLQYYDISSTEIRQGLKRDFLSPDVAQYIDQNEIYNQSLERGKALYAAGDFGGAINAWSECRGGKFHEQAETLTQLASEILAYSYTEIYNP